MTDHLPSCLTVKILDEPVQEDENVIGVNDKMFFLCDFYG